MFCHTILLGTHLDSVLALNPALGHEFEPGIAHILPSLVVMQYFDLLLALVLCKCLKLLKGVEYIRFGTNGQNKAKSGIVSHQ